MEIKRFIDVAIALPKEDSILITGDHGIGKSEAVYQIGAKLGLPVMERRLSQQSEGDLIGLPWKNEKNGSTGFYPPDWFMECTKKGHLLFLDEINRATPEVMQAAFELVLDRRLNGFNLHKDCRVFAAINTGTSYQVNQMDPALLDRFFIVELRPTSDEWLEWAANDGKVTDLVRDFIRQNPKHLEHTATIEPGKIYPSRRSWTKFSRAMDKLNLEKCLENGLLYPVCLGYTGVEAAIQFTDFVKNAHKILKAEDVLDKWSETEKYFAKNKVSNERIAALIERITTNAGEANWTSDQAENVNKFLRIIPPEFAIKLFSGITTAKAPFNEHNIGVCHKLWKEYVVGIILASEALNKKDEKSEEQSQ